MNILIVDDNAEQSARLQELVGEALQGASITCRDTGRSALVDITAGTLVPDIVLADIDLGKESGIDVARQILDIVPRAQVIFVSGYDNYYLDVYDVEHVWFLRKPVEAEALGKALSRAEEKLSGTATAYFYYEANRRKHMVPIGSILYIDIRKRLIRVHTDRDPSGDTHTFYGILRDVEAQLAASPRHKAFLRCHHSYIVNLNRVTAFDATGFYVDDQKVPVSRRYRKEAEQAFAEVVERRMG